MRTFTRTIGALALTVATAVGACVATAPAAHADDKCLGFPDIPQAYVCIVSVTPENALPTVNPNAGAVTVPSFCYLLGCVPDTPVPTPSVIPGTGSIAVITYAGQQYVVPADPTTLIGGLPGVPNVGGILVSLIQNILDKTTNVMDQLSIRNCTLYSDGTIGCHS